MATFIADQPLEPKTEKSGVSLREITNYEPAVDDPVTLDDLFLRSKSLWLDIGDAKDAKIGNTIRIRFPADYTVSDGPELLSKSIQETAEHEAIFGRPTDTQPPSLFMVYEPGTDQMVALTQEHLDRLIAIERLYIQLASDVRSAAMRIAPV